MAFSLRNILHVAIFPFFIPVSFVYSSAGDRSVKYQMCLNSKLKIKCKTDKLLVDFTQNQPMIEKALLWSCEDECRYSCMWDTVEAFKSADLGVPQFHGKWPFVRIYGVQEPASMIFSLANAYAHVLGLRLYLSKVDSSSRLYYQSILFAVVSIHAWIWSAIFHTRDFPFTEKMDYFSATAGVLYSIYYCVFRLSLGILNPNLRNGGIIQKIAAIFLISFFIRHVYTLVMFFDYGYNMFVNVVAGLLNGSLWILYHILTRRKFSHQWMATTTVLYTSCLLGLELLDFAPIFWLFDAHAMWHLGTVVFPFLWYPFMVEESRLCIASPKIA